MPIVIPKDIPAFSILKKENIFVMPKKRAESQDIRPIEIAVVNLMPTKIETETQLLRLLANTPLQVNLTLIKTATYKATNASENHMERFYKTFDEVKDVRFDGMIVTGAPVENLDFKEVAYWEELKRIFDYADKMVTSTIFICWGAQAAMYHYYGIEKKALPKKLFGVFTHHKVHFDPPDPLMRGISDEFHVCHSRHSTVRESDIRRDKRLKILATSHRAGVAIASSTDHSQIFVLGHMEYDRDTLKKEYERDLAKGLPIEKPFCYFADKECTKINMNWSSTANLFYNNWLNFVYQTTPYQFDK